MFFSAVIYHVRFFEMLIMYNIIGLVINSDLQNPLIIMKVIMQMDLLVKNRLHGWTYFMETVSRATMHLNLMLYIDIFNK